MKFTTRVRNAIEGFSGAKAQNDLSGRRMASDFLRNGNSKRMVQDWSQVEMSDQDMYTGYSYAAIRKRANRASALGKKFLYTEASDTITEAAKKKGNDIEHPYLTLIKDSKEFSQRKFWHDISTYLDLEGVYYLMAVRAVGQNTDNTPKVGAIQKFVMMNPYEIRRVLKGSTNELGGYVEAHDGLYREIPKEMVIEIRLLNPFNNDLPYSMTDAAKESQFTLKQAGDYTRHSIQGNTNAPGAITTDVQLEDNIFDNFVSRIQNHTKGEPLYGNGAGAIKWEAMQIDLDKAALDKINEIHRSILFAVSGTSKTTLGIEESGTTRDTSQVQKDNFTEDAVMPQIEDIIDALNLDYRQNYPEWDKDKYEICLDNPLESDREAELKDIELRENEYDLTQKLVSMGYEYEIAAKYAQGEIDVAELGEPTLEEEITPQQADALAAQEAGFNPSPGEASSEPQQTDGTGASKPAPGATAPTAPATGANSVARNKFVRKEDNEKILKEARTRLKAKIKAQKEADKASKKASKTTKKKPEEKPVETPPVISEAPVEPTVPTIKVEVVAPQANGLEVIKIANQLAARDVPGLYDGMGIDFDKLGCIMLNTTKIPVAQYVPESGNDVVSDGSHSGLVGETEPHVTLLFGLLENGNTWKNKVDSVLETWNCPTVTINRVSFFDLGDQYAIVGIVEKSNELVDGHERLTLLPHINTFSEYIPHITLAYVQHDEAIRDKWVFNLNKRYEGQLVQTRGINYGDLPETEEVEENSSSPKVENHIEDEHDMSKNEKACVCCNGSGEHNTGFECYRCDASGQENDAIGSVPCEGREDSPLVEKMPDGSYEHANTAPQTYVGHVHEHNHLEDKDYVNPTLERATNALEPETRDRVVLGQTDLLAATQNIESDMVNDYITAIQNGNFNEARRIISESDEKKHRHALEIALKAYFLLYYPVYAQQLMAERAGEFDKQGVFAMTDQIENQIKTQAEKGAESHINTITDDLDKAVHEAVKAEIVGALIDQVTKAAQAQDKSVLKKLPLNPNAEDITKAVEAGAFDDTPLHKRARDLAREGNGRDAIARALRKEYADISKTRAVTIARHETNRVFNMAQYQADLQFLTESGLMENAYKVLHSRTGDPCPICESIITQTNASPIPFRNDFASLGETLTATYTSDRTGKTLTQRLPINYESITAGNVHVNCNCEYVLIIKQDDGSFLNQVDGRVFNAGGNPNHDAVTGQFSEGGGAASALALDTATSANKKLAKTSSGKVVAAQVAKVRESTDAFLEAHGGSADKFHEIDDNWVGNDYKQLEGYSKSGKSKEVELMNKLQQAYFKKNGVTEVTVYRGVYNKQASDIKAAIKAGKPIKIASDYASSWTGYAETARGYAEGGAFTAPDKISDSVVIKQTFKVKDILYSTQVAPYKAGNADDEFIVKSPSGFTVDPGDIEVMK